MMTFKYQLHSTHFDIEQKYKPSLCNYRFQLPSVLRYLFSLSNCCAFLGPNLAIMSKPLWRRATQSLHPNLKKLQSFNHHSLHPEE